MHRFNTSIRLVLWKTGTKSLWHLFGQYRLWLLLNGCMLSCEPYDLSRKSFPNCVKPSATIGVVIDKLEVTLFLDNPQGTITVVGWDLGDGRNKLGDPIKIAYAKQGTYMVTAILNNPCDEKFTISRAVTVQN